MTQLPPAYIINRVQDKERLKRALASLKQHGIVPTIFAAIEPEKGTEHLMKGELGCLLSHKAIIEDGEGTILVFEDDVVLDSLPPPMPDDYDLYYWGYAKYADPDKSLPCPGHPELQRPYKPVCTHAYQVSAEGRERLKLMWRQFVPETFYRAVDHYYAECPYVRKVAVNVPVARQAGGSVIRK
jgi:hypothetical protein